MTLYDVGYKKPPPQHRFAKGQSGNPNGRPRKANRIEIETIVASAISGKVSFTIRGQRKRASRDEVFLRSLLKKALGGYAGAADEILTMLVEGRRRNEGPVQIEVRGWLPDYPGQNLKQAK